MYVWKGGVRVYKERIQQALDYIENNLKAEITAAELAKNAGYSLFHFYRLFQGAAGMPVMQYIIHRRLLHAIYEIGGGRKKTDVVLEYGFDTYAGFYKSFVREIGYTPAEYLRKFKVKKPYRINLFQEEHIVVSHKKIAEMLSYWGLEGEPVADVVFEENGETSDTAKYVGEQYVIKYTNNPGNVIKAINIAKALTNAGLSAPVIVPTADGKEFVQNGELYFFLSRRIEGKGILASHVYLEEYGKKARFIGEIVGHLDLALAAVDVPVDDEDTLSAVCNWAVPALKSILPLPPDFMEGYMQEFHRLYPLLPRQIIHRDPNPSNIILSDDKWGFIDFELSERNVRIFDPCYAATAILSETYEDGNEEKMAGWTRVMKEIMLGYDSVVQLTDAEKEAVPYIILANQFVATAWFSERDKFLDFYNVNKKMTLWVIRNFEKMKI